MHSLMLTNSKAPATMQGPVRAPLQCVLESPMSSSTPATGSSNPFESTQTQPASATVVRKRVPLVILTALWGIPAVLSQIAPDSIAQFMFSGLLLPTLCGLALVGWWSFRTAVLPSHRVITAIAALGALGLPFLLSHKSVNFMVVLMYGVPYGVTAACVWLLLTGNGAQRVRFVGLIAIAVLTVIAISMVRVHGVTGAFQSEFDWRWNPSPEERLLARSTAGNGDSASANSASADSAETATLTLRAGDWSEFRGPSRHGAVQLADFQPDWKASPPKELWRQPVGPAWSSFCVVDGRVITQEQLGDQELVICRDVASGNVIWKHSSTSRFEEPVAGAGPRGTPTFSDGKLYIQGARGTIACLDAGNGKVIWERDVVKETGASIPEWGFSASPLVYQGRVTTFAGAEDKALITFDAVTGAVIWTAGSGKVSYCSPQISSVCNQEQMLFCTDKGVTAFEPATGTILWKHDWPTEGVARITQPAVLSNTDGTSDVVIGTGLGVGLRRIHVAKEGDTWNVTEKWTTTRCKPYFNDFVVRDDHLFGFDGTIFMCVQLSDGEVKWRARGYGSGQVVLVEPSGHLIILSETGDLAVVPANPQKHEEISRLHAIDGKTWNHPVVADGKLFARNGVEAVCYELSPGTPTPNTDDSASSEETTKD